MPSTQFFVSGTHAPGDLVALEGGDARKIRTVLRMRDGEPITIVDSAGTTYHAKLVFEGERIGARLHSTLSLAHAGTPRIVVDVAQAVPKGQKMDFVVEKVTELGARVILPFESERSMVGAVGTEKLARWGRLARTAAQQSGRTKVPHIEAPLGYDELLGRFGAYDVVLFAWELAERRPLRETLPALIERADSALVVVGPEGGFTHEEAQLALEQSAKLLWLGEQILRSETAAMVLLSVLNYAK